MFSSGSRELSHARREVSKILSINLLGGPSPALAREDNV
jgi:hypothetical protein